MSRRREEPRRRGFESIRRAEIEYARSLRKVARQIGDFVQAFEAGDPSALPALEQTMERYSLVLEPWARATTERMLAEVSRRSEGAWIEHASRMSAALRREIREAPTGEVMRGLLEEQVTLIRSLPIESAQRVHKLTMEGLVSGARASEIAEEIGRSGEVSISRANLIARTEVARSSSALTQARAEHIGSEGYEWVTARDSDVRPSHRKMSGKFVRWDEPPTLDGMTAHAGGFPNCRCTMLPQIPDL